MAGQIIEKGPNKYMIRVYLGEGEGGTRKYHSKTITGSRKDATKYLNEVLHKKNTDQLAISGKTTVKQHIDDWFEVIKNRVAQKTLISYKELMRLHVIPAIGSYRLDKVKPVQIQLLYNEMTEQGLSPRTVRYCHTVLKSCLNQAVRWEHIYKNPADSVSLPKKKRAEVSVFTPAQAAKFMEAIVYSPYNAFFSLMISSGMRPSEALGLKWSDIDFINDRVTVSRTLNRGKGGWTLEETKTDRSRRSIPLPKTTIADLKAHKTAQALQMLKTKDYTRNDFVFATKTGEPLERRNIITKQFKPLLRGAGLPDMRLYDLRHACATLLLTAGVNPKIVSERLGHASIILTLDTYSHVLPDMQKGAADKLEKILFSDSRTGT